MTTSPTSSRRVELIEQTIARVRLGAVAGSYLLIAFGGENARSYRIAAAVVITLAAAYSITMAIATYRLAPEASAALDLGFTVAIIATTGAGRSIAIGILFLVLPASALRFPPRVSRITAIAGSFSTAIVILVVPRPDLALALRVELAMGWSAALLLASMLIALLSDLELRERADLLVERERALSLTEQDTARRRTLNMVAHDLTPPLAAVEGIARTLQDSSIDLAEDDRDEALSILLEHAKHLKSFATSFREVANAGDPSKLQRPNLTSLDLHQFVEQLCRAQTFQPSHEVRFELRSPLPPITTDPDKLRRVMVNLIDNALRHSPAGQSVVVAADRQDANALITVLDSGNGVPEADLEAIFTPHWQGPGKVGEGGLGLWIVGELVNDLRGSVTARNGPQRGLEVEIRLPLI